MNDTVTITSAKNGSRFTLSNVTDDSFTATIDGPSFSGSLIIPSYFSGFPHKFFEELAAEWRGWNGAKQWSSLEGELHLQAKSDKLGHVCLTVSLGIINGRDDWKLQTDLMIESGQLESLAKSLNGLFSELKFQTD